MSRPASPARAVAALTAVELRLVLRRAENLFATIVIPTLVLALFSSLSVLPAGAGHAVDFLLPGSIALAIVATSLVSLGITTAYDRSYGVLKRLGGSPLSRAELVLARLLTVLAVEVVQIALLLATATVALGWSPGSAASPLLLFIAVLIGTAAFAGLGLALAGTLRAETVLALANLLFVGFLVLGGIVLPLDHLPAPLAAFAGVLPAAPLAEMLRVALDSAAADAADVTGPLVVLCAWAAATLGLAARHFSWD